MSGRIHTDIDNAPVVLTENRSSSLICMYELTPLKYNAAFGVLNRFDVEEQLYTTPFLVVMSLLLSLPSPSSKYSATRPTRGMSAADTWNAVANDDASIYMFNKLCTKNNGIIADNTEHKFVPSVVWCCTSDVSIVVCLAVVC